MGKSALVSEKGVVIASERIINRPINHAVFGYGSLISAESALKTSKSLTSKPFPCVIRGIERAWNKRSLKGMTAMGVQLNPSGTCAGVLYPVNQKQLARFDQREKGYNRHEVDIRNVHLLEYLDAEAYDYDEHQIFLDAVEGLRNDVRVWVYIPSDPTPPDEKYPIAQTYVDVILQGCLEIHEELARDVIERTKGWNVQELLTDDDGDCDDDEDDTGNEEGVDNDNDEDVDSSDRTEKRITADIVAWVNDREMPIYVRADTDYSLREGHRLDTLLREHRPEFHSRKRLTKPKTKGKRVKTFLQLQFPEDNY